MHIETLQLQDRHRWLFVDAVEPGSRSAEAMQLLGTWAATRDVEAARAATAAATATGRPGGNFTSIG